MQKADALWGVLLCNRKFRRISYYIKIAPLWMRPDACGIMTACGSLHLARKEYKSLMSEGYRELKRTCPLCSVIENTKMPLQVSL